MNYEDPCYRELAIYHYVIGAMLVDKDFRSKALEVLPEKAMPEIDPIVAAIATSDATAVWNGFSHYGIRQEGQETVLEAILRTLASMVMKRQIRDGSKQLSNLMSDWGSEESKIVATRLQDALAKYLGNR